MLRKDHFVALILIAVFVVLIGQTALAAEKPPFLKNPIFTAKTPDARTRALITKIDGPSGPLTITNFAHFYILPFNGLPHWYRMVGQDPANPANNGTTTIPTTIYPLQFTFTVDQTGSPSTQVLDGNNILANVENSPIFATTDYSSGTGVQYGDAIQRGSLWNFVTTATPNWHTNLGGPAVGPTQAFTVPASAGFWVDTGGAFPPFGLMDFGAFDGMLSAAIGATNPDPTGLPIYLSQDVYLFFGNPGNCCVLGFHSAFSSFPSTASHKKTVVVPAINTFIWDSWISPGLFGSGFQDITGLSHETSEWYADPFINNGLPIWVVPPDTVCISSGPNQNRFNNILEVGDAIEVLPNPTFPVTVNGFTYNPQDEALVSFFTQDVPSNGIGGFYSFQNQLPAPATYCPGTN